MADARLSARQTQLVAAALADLREWIGAERELAETAGDTGGVEALDRVLVETGRRMTHPHVGTNLARQLREPDSIPDWYRRVGGRG